MSTGTGGKTILIVDDAPSNIAHIAEILRQHYRTSFALNGRDALERAMQLLPDLILLDIDLPEMDGYEICSRLKADPVLRDIPVIFLTSRRTVHDEEKGLLLGAVDYISKPISPPIVMARVKTHLALSSARSRLVRENLLLDKEVNQRVEEVQAVQDLAILAMAMISETRDHETGQHVRRTQRYVQLLMNELIRDVRFAHELSDLNVSLIVKSTPLHDVGKIGIPDALLRKPGKLAPDEFEIMKQHTTIGRDALAAVELQIGQHSAFLQHAREIAYLHHERWDGSGYPLGLASQAIPISARVMAVADVYDALVSKRPYKKPVAHKAAVEVIENGAGTHFDPDIVRSFLRIHESFREQLPQQTSPNGIAGHPQTGP